MKTLFNSLLMMFLVSVVSCTSLSEGGSPDPLPNPDHDRRVQQGSGNLDNVREEMDSQSSVINRKKNIEESHSYGPATTPTKQRPHEVPNAPVDSANHREPWPVLPKVEAGE